MIENHFACVYDCSGLKSKTEFINIRHKGNDANHENET